jgi:hypothetical protein
VEVLLLHGFDIGAFLRFLAQLPPGPDRAFFLDALEEARQAHQAGNDPWLRRCLGDMFRTAQLWHAVPHAQKKIAAAAAASRNGRLRARRRREHSDEEVREWIALAAGPNMPASLRGKAKRVADLKGRPIFPWAERIRSELKKAAAAKKKKAANPWDHGWIAHWLAAVIDA